MRRLARIDPWPAPATANFLGLRTTDALIRFHGRWGLGLPSAVSHHAYGAASDAGGTARAWREWLGQTLAAAAVDQR